MKDRRGRRVPSASRTTRTGKEERGRNERHNMAEMGAGKTVHRGVCHDEAGAGDTMKPSTKEIEIESQAVQTHG